MKYAILLSLTLFVIHPAEAGTKGRCCDDGYSVPREERIRDLKEKLNNLVNTPNEERSEKFNANWYRRLTEEIDSLEGIDDFRLAGYGLTKEDIYKYHGKSKALEICRVNKNETNQGLELAKDLKNQAYNLESHLNKMTNKEREAKQEFDVFIQQARDYKKMNSDLLESWTQTANSCLLTDEQRNVIKQDIFKKHQCSLAAELTSTTTEVEKLLATNSYGDFNNPWLSQLFMNHAYGVNNWILEVENRMKRFQESEPTVSKQSCVDAALKVGHKTILKMYSQIISAHDQKVKELQKQLSKLNKRNRMATEDEIKALEKNSGKHNENAGLFILYMTKKDFPNNDKAE